ncbi:MAG: tRNA preQ1(34) S-adenosylmethionine ribosyltransferase-isomerase QueA [Spirochaetae bacterium HGW-Spirochaetae-9]|nr:MAG: tRNA preQ1(34) S-adenosylmethionine ribosyltransferase-isomerase QueA [Spirochaetae bacterium HGW-Spirochaetae-9]
MRTDDFNFDLPEASIAQYPPEKRGDSRLLVLDRDSSRRTASMVRNLASFLEPGTLMVFNDSKVRKARIYGTALDTGAVVEFLLLAPLTAQTGASANSVAWRAMTSKAKKQKVGRSYLFPGGIKGSIVGEEEDDKIIEFSEALSDMYLDQNGHMPLPPYIKRKDEDADAERYQTVYARTTGSAACPTAGLHFTQSILDSIAADGIEMAWVTLHVGLGTFLPVRVDEVERHRMHEEWYTVSDKTAAAVNAAKKERRKVLAVGTTSLRTLESAWIPGNGLQPGSSSTSIFIYPGYRFNVVDQLFTNFHTPKSTLLMLVAAFAGRDSILATYAEAIREGYRFFSYGDAMLIR